MDKQILQNEVNNKISKYTIGEITRLVMYTQIALIPKSMDEAKYVIKIMPESIKKSFFDWINEFDSNDPEKQIGIDCPDIIPLDIIKEFKSIQNYSEKIK